MPGGVRVDLNTGGWGGGGGGGGGLFWIKRKFSEKIYFSMILLTIMRGSFGGIFWHQTKNIVPLPF